MTKAGWWEELEVLCAAVPGTPGCNVYNGGKGVVEGTKESMADAAVQSFESSITWSVNQMAAGASQAMQAVATFWMNPAWTPTIATNTVCDNTNCPPDTWDRWQTHPVIANLGLDLSWVVMVFLILGTIAGVVRMIWDMRAMELVNIARAVVLTMASATAIVAMVQICLIAGDAFSKTILDAAAARAAPDYSQDSALEGAFTQLVVIPDTQFTGSILFLMIILLAILLIASVMQIGFMLVRSAMLFIMAVMLPVVAAGASTPDGMARFKKMIAYLVAFVLYKPVAAVIYAVGFSLLNTAPIEGGDLASMMQTFYGFTIITAAALALPALIKFTAPIASIGSSNAFSGAVGVAAGAAVGVGAVALGAGAATGGAGMAGTAGSAAGGSAAGGSAGGAGAGGSAAGMVGRHNGGGGGASPPAPPSTTNTSGSDSDNKGAKNVAGVVAKGATRVPPPGAPTTPDDVDEGGRR